MSVLDLADRQHGVVARWQLGWSDKAVRHARTTGRLHDVHRGVYAVGRRRITQRGAWMAAVLAAGHGAVLSHRSAAALWGLRQSAALEVTATRHCRRPGIAAYHAVLPADERALLDAIPVTTVARTLLDLAAVVPRHELEAALHQAEWDQRADATSLDALLARYPRRRGTATLRALLSDLAEGAGIARSDLELAFMAFLDAHGLPRPRRNVIVEGYECDCVWAAQRVIVELDGRGHAASRTFESDRVRDFRLTLAGWRVVRITWRRLHRDPELRADLQALLSAPAARWPS